MARCSGADIPPIQALSNTDHSAMRPDNEDFLRRVEIGCQTRSVSDRPERASQFEWPDSRRTRCGTG